jgi:hypothetical protein
LKKIGSIWSTIILTKTYLCGTYLSR